MYGKKAKTSASSTSMLSAKKETKKIRAKRIRPSASLIKYGEAKVVSRSSSSPLAEVYKTDDFRNEWANEVQFHVARNVLHLRRYRKTSQASLAQAMGTSQSAIARIESGQENITLDTLRRLVAALKGRFFVSIPPQECCTTRQISPWWEISSPAVNRWSVVGYTSMQTEQTEQLIVGLERRHERLLSGNTLPGASGMLLETSRAGS